MQVTARNKLGQKPEGQSPQVAVKRRDLGNAMYGYAWLGGDVRSLGKARMGAHTQRRGSMYLNPTHSSDSTFRREPTK